MIARAECEVFDFAEEAEEAWARLAATDLGAHRD